MSEYALQTCQISICHSKWVHQFVAVTSKKRDMCVCRGWLTFLKKLPSSCLATACWWLWTPGFLLPYLATSECLLPTCSHASGLTASLRTGMPLCRRRVDSRASCFCHLAAPIAPAAVSVFIPGWHHLCMQSPTLTYCVHAIQHNIGCTTEYRLYNTI